MVKSQRLQLLAVVILGLGQLALGSLDVVSLDVGSLARAENPAGKPILRLDGDGPGNHESCAAFSPDGSTLFTAGWDKVVRVWRRDVRGVFQLDSAATFRIPIGPGLEGAINAIAVSRDGRWLAVGGKGVFQGEAGFQGRGKIVSTTAMTPEMRKQQGVIHVFHTQTREAKRLQGHLGEIVALQFDPAESQRLASAAREWDAASGAFVGSVRVWDVDAATPLQQSPALPEPTERPQLQFSNSTPTRVAMSWKADGTDNLFRIWDLKTQVMQQQSDYTGTVVKIGRHFVTGSFAARSNQGFQGVLRFWPEDQQTALREDRARRIVLRGQGNSQFIPYSIAPVSDSRLAVGVLRVEPGANGFEPRSAELHLIAMEQGRSSRLLRRVTLWNSESAFPRLPGVTANRTNTGAASHLAVTGSPRNELMLFRVADLTEPTIRVSRKRLAAHRFQGIRFVASNQRLGLLLQQQQGAALVMPFDERNIATDDGNWSDASQSQAGYAVRSAPEKGRQVVQVSGGSTIRSRIVLPDGHQATTVAVSEQTTDRKSHLVAIASQFKGRPPRLAIYDAEKEIPLRQLTGHTQRIDALTFSQDGKWLASLSNGYSVCIWNLTDLTRVAGQRGQLTGLEVVLAQPESVGLKVLKAGEFAAELQPGDVILSHIVDQQEQAWNSEREFYDTWWQLKPSTQVKLRVQRARQTLTVPVTVRQGMDERKPLFSVFVAPHSDSPERFRWVAWSPLGPFDSSDREIENTLGWHFNGDAGSQGAEGQQLFTPLGRYRDRFHRPFLVRDLLREPGTLPAPRQARVPEIDLSVVDARVDRTGAAEVTSADPRPTLEMLVDSTFPARLMERAEIRIDGKDALPLKATVDGAWVAQLAEPLDRSVHRIRGALVTREVPQRVFYHEILVRYQPGPPNVALEPLPAATTRGEVSFKAKISPRESAGAFRVELRRQGSESAIGSWSDQAEIEIDHVLPLDVGENQFEFWVANVDADGRPREEEVKTHSVTVTRTAKRVQPPKIAMKYYLLSDRRPRRMNPGETVRVDESEIRMIGSLSSVSPLASAARGDGNGVTSTLRGFKPGITRELPIDEKFSLVVGTQMLKIRLENEDDVVVEHVVVVEYQPPIPVAEVLPVSKQETATAEAGLQETIELVAQLPESGAPTRAGRTVPNLGFEFLLNDQVIAAPTHVVEENGQRLIKTRVPVETGVNAVRVKTTVGAVSRLSEPLLIENRVAPKVTKTEVQRRGENAMIDVVIEGQGLDSGDDLLLGGHRVPRDQVTLRRQGGRDLLTIKDIDLPREATLRLGAKSVPLPKLASYVPTQDDKIEIVAPEVSQSRIVRVVITMRSEMPIERMDVFKNDGPVTSLDRPVAERNANGLYIARKEIEIPLHENSNVIEVQGRSRAGNSSARAHVNYFPRPVTLEVLGFARSRTGEIEIEPSQMTGGAPYFRSLDTGNVWLRARLDISSQTAQKLGNGTVAVRIWVNGFQQLPVPVEFHDGNRRVGWINANILLSKPRDNLIEVTLPGVDVDVMSLRSFLVERCADPVRTRRMHLVVASVDHRMAESDLVSQAVAALHGSLDEITAEPGRQVSRVTFSTPSFGTGIVYRPLTARRLTRRRVMGQIAELKEEIRQWKNTKSGTDFVVIYYQGAELVDRPEGFYLTTRRTDDEAMAEILRNPRYLEDYGVRSDQLNSLVESSPGAYLMLFDVDRKSVEGRGKAEWPSDSRAGLLRYAWLGSRGGEPKGLLSDLRTVVPEVQVLGDVRDRLRQMVRDTQDASVRYEYHLPTALQDVAFGGG